MQKIKIIVVRPNKQPQIKEIKSSIESLYGIVYYPYKEIQLEKNVWLIYSKEAQESKFPLCRKYKDKSIYSNFVIVAKNKDKFISLNKNQIIRYIKMFKN